MKTSNAIIKLKKAGYEIHYDARDYITARLQNCKYRIQFHNNFEYGIDLIRTISDNDHDDNMTDYCAGQWHDNLSQAMNRINKEVK